MKRAKTVLRGWANSEPAAAKRDTSVAQEMERIKQAISTNDQDVLRKYGGLNPAMRRHLELGKLPTTQEADGGLIDGYAIRRTKGVIEPDSDL